jgi:uncharacterized membrane protein YfcA
MSRTAFLAAVVLLAFVVESAAGFGATVVTVTLGAQLLPLDAVLGAFLPVNVVLSLVLVARNARAIDRAFLVRRILPWMGLGTAIGLTFARFRAETWIKIVFAAFVVLLSLFELVTLRRKSEERVRPLALPVAAAALSTAGVVHGLFACGGPLVVYVVSRTLRDKASFRATLSALWLIMNVVLVATMVRDGTIAGASLLTSAALVPPLLLGLVVGNRLHHRLDERSFRVAVFSLLLVAASVLLLRSL